MFCPHLQDVMKKLFGNGLGCTFVSSQIHKWWVNLSLFFMLIFQQINWEYRKIGKALHNCYVYVDGTDCPVQEPQFFDRRYYSHKFKRAGLRYEVAVSLDTADIVWVHGPYPCGSYPDVLIFRRCMKGSLDEDEFVLADKGYGDNRCLTPKTISSPISPVLHEAFADRHETVNKRLKDFLVLRRLFRHDRSLHGLCFHAVANVVQHKMKRHPLYDVKF